LQLLNVGASNGPADRACVVHHSTVELLVQQYIVFDGQVTPLVKVRAKHLKLLNRHCFYLVDLRRVHIWLLQGTALLLLTVLSLRKTGSHSLNKEKHDVFGNVDSSPPESCSVRNIEPDMRSSGVPIRIARYRRVVILPVSITLIQTTGS
jgi:hypothetical protein